jgi:hypothetical protein
LTPLKQFENKLPTHRRKNELIALVIIGTITLSTILCYTYIINSPMIPSDLPAINIISDGDDITNEDYIDCKFELISKNSKDSISLMNARIKIRGHANAKEKIPKKGYRLELTKQKSLLGMQKDDDWHLLAMYFDFPRMRIKASFELWRSLKPFNPTAILPDSEYVRLYINGRFLGLYLLTERVDQKLFGLDDAQNSIDSSLVFQDKKVSNFRKYENSAWQQDWPNEDEGIFIMDEIMTDLFNFVSNTSDEVFFDSRTGIYSKFDKLNLIDFFLYNFFINHKDFWNTNYFIVRNTEPSKFYLIPWDFDGSFGQRGWTIFDYKENPESKIFDENELFNRLICNEEFMKDCKNRWSYLREEVWTDEFIFTMISDIYDENKDYIKIDTKMWKPITVDDESLVYNRYLYSTKEFDLEEYVNGLLEFVPKRLEFCDSYFIEKLDSFSNTS